MSESLKNRTSGTPAEAERINASNNLLKGAFMGVTLGLVIGVLGDRIFQKYDEKIADNTKPTPALTSKNSEGDTQLLQKQIATNKKLVSQNRALAWWNRIMQVQVDECDQELEALIAETESDPVLNSEDQLLKQCADIEEKRAEKRAEDFITKNSITDPTLAEEIRNEYRRGCEINNVTNEKIILTDVDKFSCDEIEMDEPLKTNYVSEKDEKMGSEADKAVLDHYRNHRYSQAIEEFSGSMDEIYKIADQNPGIKNFPFYNKADQILNAIYDDLKRGDTLNAFCKISAFFNYFFVEERYDDDGEGWADTLKADEQIAFGQILQKILILLNVAIASYNEQNGTNYDDEDIFSDPKIQKQCLEMGYPVFQKSNSQENLEE